MTDNEQIDRMMYEAEMEERKMTYQIEAKDGTIYGTYEGETAEEAFDAMVADGMGDEETAGTIEDWIVTQVDEGR